MLHLGAVESRTLGLLKSLHGIAELQHFYLAGGTALALRFGHRLSIDLDFFTAAPFEGDDLLRVLDQYYAVTIMAQAKNTLTVSLDSVKVDFIRHDYPIIKPVSAINELRIASPEDIGAMKLNSITNRGAKKDFFDLHELLRHFPLSTLFGFYVQKYRYADVSIALKSISYFDDAEIEPDPVSLRKLSWNTIKKDLSEVVRTFGI